MSLDRIRWFTKYTKLDYKLMFSHLILNLAKQDENTRHKGVYNLI